MLIYGKKKDEILKHLNGDECKTLRAHLGDVPKIETAVELPKSNARLHSTLDAAVGENEDLPQKYKKMNEDFEAISAINIKTQIALNAVEEKNKCLEDDLMKKSDELQEETRRADALF